MTTVRREKKGFLFFFAVKKIFPQLSLPPAAGFRSAMLLQSTILGSHYNDNYSTTEGGQHRGGRETYTGWYLVGFTTMENLDLEKKLDMALDSFAEAPKANAETPEGKVCALRTYSNRTPSPILQTTHLFKKKISIS